MGRCLRQSADTGRAPRVRSGVPALPSPRPRHHPLFFPLVNRRPPARQAFDSIGRLTDDFVAEAKRGRRPMELFAKLFDSLLVFVYHCFDRIVIHGYLSALSRPEQVVYFFHHVLGMPVVDKEVLRQRTNDYQGWVEAYARNHNIPIQWAEKGVRKEDQVLPSLHRTEKANACGVYFIFKSMEQGRTFR